MRRVIQLKTAMNQSMGVRPTCPPWEQLVTHTKKLRDKNSGTDRIPKKSGIGTAMRGHHRWDFQGMPKLSLALWNQEWRGARNPSGTRFSKMFDAIYRQSCQHDHSGESFRLMEIHS